MAKNVKYEPIHVHVCVLLLYVTVSRILFFYSWCLCVDTDFASDYLRLGFRF